MHQVPDDKRSPSRECYRLGNGLLRLKECRVWHECWLPRFHVRRPWPTATVTKTWSAYQATLAVEVCPSPVDQDWSLIRLFNVICRTLIYGNGGGGLPLSQDAVSVFFSLSWLGWYLSEDHNDMSLSLFCIFYQIRNLMALNLQFKKGRYLTCGYLW